MSQGMPGIRLLALLGMTIALLACAPREHRPAGDWLEERALLFAANPAWAVSGRLSLSDGQRGGQLAFDWRADGPDHEVMLRTVMGGRQWRLRFGPEYAHLEGSEVGELWGASPDPLVEAAVGWPIPVQDLAWWIRGLVPPDEAAGVRFAADGSLAFAESPPWLLSFQRFEFNQGVLMPSRLQAESSSYRVRMVLRDWTWGSHEMTKSL